MQRLVKGGFEATNLLDDALLIALVETGIPLWAVDADRVREPLGIGTSSDGRLAVCHADGPIATLFGACSVPYGVTRATARMLIYTVQVPGVPPIFVDEAMWTCLGVLQDAG